jgi:hypothetical protein
MVSGEFLMAFCAVWTVHHDTHETPKTDMYPEI